MTEVGLPYNILDGTVNDAVQVMANFNALKAALEAVSSVAAPTDGYQAGVLTSTDWVPGAGSVNSGTGAITLTTFGGVAWLPGAVSGIVRTSTAAATVGPLVAPKLPLASGFINVGVELTQNLGAAAVSLVSGVEQASEAEALAHSAATTAGKMRVRDIILKNTAGVYSIVKERDRRPWARGAFSKQTGLSFTSQTTTTFTNISSGNVRIECGGGPLLVSAGPINVVVSGTASYTCQFGFSLDGAAPEYVAGWVRNEVTGQPYGFPVTPSAVLLPSAGSHLISLQQKLDVGGAALGFDAFVGQIVIRELVTPSANNGTS